MAEIFDRYAIAIDGQWSLEDLYKFPRAYEQVYFALEAMRPADADDTEERIIRAFQAYPWRGGYSAVNFYNQLKWATPRQRRPRIASIQYASPGWIEMILNLPLALHIGMIIASVAGSIRICNSTYHKIYSDLQSRKLLRIEVEKKQISLSLDEIKFVKRLPQKEVGDFNRLLFLRICKDSMENTMVWTEITRRQYARRTARYASDMTDREWALVEPFLPMPRRLGRPRTTDLREVVNALLYIATTGCQWRMLPKDLPPCSTVQRYFYEWRALGIWGRINHHLVMEARELEGKEASPTAGVIDSQSVKTTESGGIRGYDAGKKIKGRKRHIIVDTLGLMVGLMVHSADIQDRDGAPDLLKSIRHRWPWLLHVFADGGYAGDKLKRRLKKIGRWTVEIIKRSDKAKGFEVLPRRWVVERTFAWLGRCRRLAKDVEKSIASAEAWIMIAHIRLITRRLARYQYR